MNQRERRKLAKFRAGLILESVLGDWEPEPLIEKYGADEVDAIRAEMFKIAQRLIDQS